MTVIVAVSIPTVHSVIDIAPSLPKDLSVASVANTQMEGVSVPSASLIGPAKYKGAVVEDLQLPPAFALDRGEKILKAIELAYERDFSYFPVLSKDRKPLGYVDVTALKAKWEAKEANPVGTVYAGPKATLTRNQDDTILAHMTHFKRSKSHPYTVITPWTDLAELEEFLSHNAFAIITDPGRKFVIGVATSDDLNNFVTRRGV